MRLGKRKITDDSGQQVRPEFAAVSNIGSRSAQQDSYGMLGTEWDEYQNTGALAVLADGMGGLVNGDEASHIAVSVALEYFRSVGMGDYPHQALLQMAEQINRNVIRYAVPDEGMTGSTLVTAYVKDDRLWFLTVGDSRLYLYRGKKLIMLNREHVYARELDLEYARDIISLNAALTDPQRQALTDYIGKDGIAAYDYNIQPVELTEGDGILLMSDGVFNTLDSDEIVGAIGDYSPAEALPRLQRAVLDMNNPTQDNFTCIYVKFQ